MNNKIIYVIIFSVILLTLISAVIPFSTVPTKREIGREFAQPGMITCPKTYDGIQVDSCALKRFDIWKHPLLYINDRNQIDRGCVDSQRSELGNMPPGMKIRCELPCTEIEGDKAYPSCEYDTWIIYYEDLIKCSDGSYNYRSLCSVATTPPENIQKPIWESIIDSIIELLKSIFKALPPLFSIIGQTEVMPNTQETYTISLIAPYEIDNTYKDGTYSYRYANWALMDKNANIIKQGDWTQVLNKYEDTITITTPQNIEDYALISVIYEYNYTYDTNTKSWKITNQGVIAKEGINIATRVVVSPTPPPKPDFIKIISDILSGILDWIRSIFY